MPERVYTNRYEIVRHMARGGMAEVYLAHDQLLDRRVALKVLFPEFARDPAFVQRFRREAQSAANLNHPNIVAVFDWGEEDGTYFIVMEYVEGRSLRDAIQADGPLYPNLAADLASDIAGAPGVRPPQRRRPPGREARQHPPHPAGPGEGHRLRYRPGRRRQRGPDPDRLRHGHRHLLLPRAGPGPAGRRPLRRLLPRRRPLRDGLRDPPVHRGERHLGGLQARAGGAAPPHGGEPRRAGGSREHHPHRHGQDHRRPLRLGRRHAGRPGPVPPGRADLVGADGRRAGERGRRHRRQPPDGQGLRPHHRRDGGGLPDDPDGTPPLGGAVRAGPRRPAGGAGRARLPAGQAAVRRRRRRRRSGDGGQLRRADGGGGPVADRERRAGSRRHHRGERPGPRRAGLRPGAAGGQQAGAGRGRQAPGQRWKGPGDGAERGRGVARRRPVEAVRRRVRVPGPPGDERRGRPREGDPHRPGRRHLGGQGRGGEALRLDRQGAGGSARRRGSGPGRGGQRPRGPGPQGGTGQPGQRHRRRGQGHRHRPAGRHARPEGLEGQADRLDRHGAGPGPERRRPEPQRRHHRAPERRVHGGRARGHLPRSGQRRPGHRPEPVARLQGGQGLDGHDQRGQVRRRHHDHDSSSTTTTTSSFP